jgi:hypothetical protein
VHIKTSGGTAYQGYNQALVRDFPASGKKYGMVSGPNTYMVSFDA